APPAGSRRRPETRMSLLTLNGVKKSFGSRLVLDGVDLMVDRGWRVGVVGGNGSGKSTVLRLAAGQETADAGEVVRRRGVVVSLLPQHPLGDARTPLETVVAARPDLAELDAELHAVAERLGSPEVTADLDRMTKVLRRQEELLERWEPAGGPSLEGRARAWLAGFGLTDEEL